jgi:murein L,D-transpeptidase YafK
MRLLWAPVARCLGVAALLLACNPLFAATPFIDSLPAAAGALAPVATSFDGSGGSPTSVAAAALPQATRVLVRKAERRLFLMRGSEVLRSYRVALGLNPVGPKEREGDFRTPEGRYQLVKRNPRSDYFLSMQVSYPGPQDVARARRNGWAAGGSIMLHGLPNDPRKGLEYYSTKDWTDGCIALSNSDMLEVWMLVSDNTPIDIQP